MRCRNIALLAKPSSPKELACEKKYVICVKKILRYKPKNKEDVWDFPLILTIDTPAENMLQKRDKKKELHKKTTLTDIIAAEFKYCCSELSLQWRLFLTILFKSLKHVVNDHFRRHVDLFFTDFVYGWVEKSAHWKIFICPWSLHSLTGTMKLVKITYHLGHCKTYDRLLDNETAQAQKCGNNEWFPYIGITTGSKTQ